MDNGTGVHAARDVFAEDPRPWPRAPREERMIESLFELILQLVIEIVGEVVFEFFVALGWESLTDSMRPKRQLPPVMASIGHFLAGLCAGAVSLLVMSQRLSPYSPWPGISLLLAPLGTGLMMHGLGNLWEGRGRSRPVLFSFRAGAVFAFGMSLARFMYIEWR